MKAAVLLVVAVVALVAAVDAGVREGRSSCVPATTTTAAHKVLVTKCP